MKSLPTMLCAALFVTLFCTCSPQLSYFTQDLYKENNWSNEELKEIQFYLSEDIVLRKQVREGSSEIRSGKIKIVNGKEVEEIVIKRGTPGIFVFSPKKNRFAVSFEDSGTERYLMFGPNPNRGDRYVLLASEWKDKRGKVTYDNTTYLVSSQSSISALMVDLKRTRNLRVKSRRAEGRRLD